MKLYPMGGIEWQNSIGGNIHDILTSVEQTADGGYIIGGYSNSGINGDKTEASFAGGSYGYDYWVLKLNSTGNIEWQNTIGGNADDYLYSIQQTNDAGFILGGYSKSGVSGDKSEPNMGSNDYWVVKLNSLGIKAEIN